MLIPFLLLNQIFGIDPVKFDLDQVIAENITVFLRGALAEDSDRKPKRVHKIAIE
jgi:hypothetical protein